MLTRRIAARSHAVRTVRMVRTVRSIVAVVLFIACGLVLAAGPAVAQYFGRNKVTWTKFNWRVLLTEHFEIHYYPEEESAVRDAARMAERWYKRYTALFQTQLNKRTPLIIYANQSDFQQTQVTPELISEGTGGFTEPLRDRVVLPLTGDGDDNNHVIGHELVHVFQFDLERRRRNPAYGNSPEQAYVPLWMVEGLAEYLSVGRDSVLTAMWLRDALKRDDLPDLNKLSRDPRYFPYRWGQAFWAYVGGRWGDPAVISLYIRTTHVGVEKALDQVLGLSIKDFSREWRSAIGSAYGPFLTARQAASGLGQRVIPQKGKTMDQNVAPSLSPDGNQVIFLSTRGLFSFDLYLADAHSGQITRRILSSESDPHFDSLRFIDSAGSWSPDGQKFALISYARGRNEITVVDVASGHVERQYAVPGVGMIWDPAWSPDGRTIAFSGAAGGSANIYLLDVDGGKARMLTDDEYTHLQPAWSPDGRSVAYVTDRGPATSLTDLVFGPVGIWVQEVSGNAQPKPVAAALSGDQVDPHYSPDGRQLYFISAHDGVDDLYRLELESGQIFRVTHAQTGVAGITRLSPALSVAARSGRIMFSVFDNTAFELHTLEPGQAQGELVPAAPPPGTQVAQATASPSVLPPPIPPTQSLVMNYLADPSGVQMNPEEKQANYRPRLQLEAVSQGVGAAYSTFGYAVGGDISAIFGDMLDQYLLGVNIQGGSSTFHDYGGSLFFLDQRARFQWGVAAGHLPFVTGGTSVTQVGVDTGNGVLVPGFEFDQVIQSITQDQFQLIGQYPFSSTRRVEGTVSYNRIGFSLIDDQLLVANNQVVSENRFHLPTPPALNLYQGSVALVGDNSAFGFTSPVQGQRYRLEVGTTTGDLNFQTVTGDYRRYFFYRPLTLALRGLHFGRYGSDAENAALAPLYVGDPTLVHGYDINNISSRECTPVPGNANACPEFDRLVGSRLAVLNLELRVPLFGSQNFGLVELPFLPTELAFFADAGTAWNANDNPHLSFATHSTQRIPVTSVGATTRILLGGIAVLEFYVAKPFQRPGHSTVTGFTIAPGW